MGDKSIVDEISQMEDSLTADDDGLVTEAPTTDAPAEVTTDAPSTDAPTTDAPTDDLSTDAPATDAPTTDAPDEMTLLKAEIAELKSLMKGEKKAPTTKAPSTSAPVTDAPVIDEDFLGELDLDDLTRDPKLFNNLLNAIYKKGVETAKANIRLESQGVLRSIPEIVKTNIAIVTSLKKASEKFYEENKDLAPFKKVVASVFEEVASANPDKTYDENLKSVGDEVRKRLDLQKKAVSNNSNNDNKSPRLPNKKGSKRSNQPPKTDAFVGELDAMEAALNS